MPIYKRGNTWYIRFTSPSGQRIQQSAKTSNKQEAERLEVKMKQDYYRVQKLGDKPAYSWNDAVVKWIKDKSEKPSLDRDIQDLRWLDQHLNGVVLTDVTRERIQKISDLRMQEGSAPATVNRMLRLIRAILRRAANIWEWIDKAPTLSFYAEPKKRIRWLTREESARLLRELPEHLRDMADFTLATGLRESNIYGLEWNQIDLERKTAWIYGDQIKNGKSLAIPLNSKAMEILNRVRGNNFRHVFTYKGKSVVNCNTLAWRKALKRARIDDFRWHDLRHTWASWHVQNGTPLHVLQELGGWSCYEMVQRYAHLSSEHLIDFASNVDNQAEKTGTNLVQRQIKSF